MEENAEKVEEDCESKNNKRRGTKQFLWDETITIEYKWVRLWAQVKR